MVVFLTECTSLYSLMEELSRNFNGETDENHGNYYSR